MFDLVQIWALAGPFKDIQRLVVVLLEGEPMPQSEVLSALDHGFIRLESLVSHGLSLL